jgi:hypothetical protein
VLNSLELIWVHSVAIVKRTSLILGLRPKEFTLGMGVGDRYKSVEVRLLLFVGSIG